MNVLDVDHLTFSYTEGEYPAVNDISFTLAEGEILGFLGPSGAGKTTTQKILTGLLKDYDGQITAFDHELSSWHHDYYTRIGVQFELPNHYLKLTALENLKYFSSLYVGDREDPYHLLELVGLADDAHVRVGNFSKGMKMRLNFVRSLLHRPQLLFLDEPTSGLDPGNARIVKDVILRLRDQGVTIFLTTHDMTVADELSDRVAFLVNGRIEMFDAPKALKLKYGRREVVVEYGDNSDGLTRETFSMDDLGNNDEFISLLQKRRIQTMHSQETTLEQIFLHVTGKELV